MHTLTLPIHNARGYSVEKSRPPIKNRRKFEILRYERSARCLNGLVIRSSVILPSEESEVLQISPIIPFDGNTQRQTLYLELSQDLIPDEDDINPDVWLESKKGVSNEIVRFSGIGIIHRSRSAEQYPMEGVFHPAGKIAARYAGLHQEIKITLP